MRLIALILTILLPCSAFATTVVALDDAELAARADTIVVGHITAVRTVVYPGGHVATDATLEVQDSLKGAPEGSTLTVEVPGGVVGGVVFEAVGAPPLIVGSLVFGYFETSGAVVRPLGLSYGLYRVWGTDWSVHRDLRGLALVTHRGAPVSGLEPVTSLPLTTLLERVRRTVGGAP
jgi:nitrous oxidase accessory protein NosD